MEMYKHDSCHIDLYDQMDKIPFDSIRRFFESALC